MDINDDESVRRLTRHIKSFLSLYRRMNRNIMSMTHIGLRYVEKDIRERNGGDRFSPARASRAARLRRRSFPGCGSRHLCSRRPRRARGRLLA